jgi:hypothetical protein
MTDSIDLTRVFHDNAPRPGGDLIVVDDQTYATEQWAHALTNEVFNCRVIAVGSVRELRKKLEAPEVPQFRPVAALVDLMLGTSEEESGLEAIRTLRDHPTTRDCVLALNTDVLDSPPRELLAVLSAEAAGGPLPMSTKDDSEMPNLRNLLHTLVSATSPGDRTDHVLRGQHGLRVVHPVTVRRANGEARTLHDLLAGRLWKEVFWKELVRPTSTVSKAHNAALAAFPVRPSSRDVIDDLQANARELGRNDLGQLPGAFDASGGSFVALKGNLDLSRVPDGDADEGKPAAMLHAFAVEYRPALENQDLYIDADG